MASSLDWLFNENPMAYQAISGLFGDQMPFDERFAPAQQATQAGVGPGNWDWFSPTPSPYGPQPQAPQAPPGGSALAFNQPQSGPSFPPLPQLKNTSQPGSADFYGGSPESNRNIQPFGARPPQMAAGAPQAQAGMPPTDQSPGLMDRFGAGLQGAGSSLFQSGGGPLGAIMNLVGGLATGKRTDPVGVQQEEMLKQYQSLQKDFGLTPAQARMVVLNKEFGKEAAKGLVNPNTQATASGDLVQTGAFGKISIPGAVPISERADTVDALGNKRPGFAIKPSLTNPQGGLAMPGGGAGGAAGGVGAGGPITELSPQRTKEQTQTGEVLANSYKTYLETGSSATKKLNTLSRMLQLSDQAFEGAAAPGFQMVRSVLASFGLDPGKVPAGEEFTALSNRMVLDAQNGSLGAGVSNADVQFIANTNPNLSQTGKGRKEIIETSTLLAKRDQEVAKMASQWRQTHGTIEGFDTALSQWAEQHPLFKDRQQSAPAAAPGGTGYKVLGVR